MTLIYDNESENMFPFDAEAAAKRVIEAASDYTGCPYEIQINLLLTDNDGIRSVNREFRHIDKETDVLSFPFLEYENPGDFSFLSDTEEYFDPESGELIIGDMMVSVEKVIAQAEEYGHSLLREYSFLVAHSMLHLFGYDHVDKEEAAVMENIQEEILQGLGILRNCH